MKIKNLKLNESTSIPVLGLGTWRLLGDKCVQTVSQALEIGYRHFDTAQHYNNQTEIGQAIKSSGLNRKDLFLTSKVWMTNLQREAVFSSLEQTLTQLQTDYLDLYLIHWPNPRVPVVETLEAMKELKQKGKIKAIGVSNFTIDLLKEALASRVEITNNQVEFHPSLNQKSLKDFCDQQNIIITAYSPLGQGDDLKLRLIKQLASKYKKSEAQIILNWLMSKNMVAIPKTADPEHLKDNFASLTWELKSEDIKKIDRIEDDNRLIDPGFIDFS